MAKDYQCKTTVKAGSAMATITVRVDDETKLKASDIAEDFGFDLSSVTRAFYRQMVRERRIPLNLSYEPTPNEQTLAAIREAEEIAQTGRRRFKNADEMFDSLGI
jgi:DNA-damage-inducible protein J